MRILLVEDNRRLSKVISDALKAHGFAVDALMTASDAEAALGATDYDAIVLDLGLPDRDGMTLLAAGRRHGIAAPVLVITAREGTQAVIEGLNGGADDYLCKPFVIDELIARIRALLRRPGHALSVLLREGNLVFDTVERRVRIEGCEIDLSRRELAALEVFMRRAARVISKADLEESMYGFGEEVGSNAIEVLVHRLRKKLSGAKATVEIHTLRGIGYLLAHDPA
ncbi:response regulator transcription factor [Lichenifustis flavocetrariae]|uniref:Response regulator transcription factor n=1 Tax=Lichenifustis flavocetrariae TaxID=2949735 RepID=A0AA42CML6_9HYPH|nr:response regulator transcription factor [Lichenifustis flavocetrariae]MCW6512814.1 response regulator transcription factor [Lichenifustis flavocetrariae]